ncbi:MAG TPA: hypothetical protein DCZ95_19750 [Verrucomicrobia bacterium]|nr:MAG: hypothetical protein A2X46_10980 [Lentisphaerae bacterium GWF2_57_35]HBA86321.1 hypothetical protein [Verrucomicrobiota bacterium]
MQDFITTAQCSESTDKILEKLESIEKRLFRDNGTISIQTRIDRHEQVIRALLWAVSVVGGAILISAVSVVVMLVRYVLTHGG